MGTKQFKAESKRLLDLMINSIYTNKEIFLRELISSASDAIDKLYFKSLTDQTIKANREDLCIRITPNKEQRTLVIEDNGCGMNKQELENEEVRQEEKKAKKKYPSVAYEMAEKVQKRTQQEVRIAIPGHTQRGGSPCPFDRVLSTRLGAEAARAILDENYGCMMSVKNDKIVRVPLSEVAGKLKYVDPKSEIVRQAKITGISFGDE